eukprot:TRINITY_DN349_c0_g1_i1.p2 TRINITY_DN349_c0_g1~~TRINITY_DN349_c0_g1_i1.p2  ORF type:complete len:724 (-),score=92.43 TRINITY_DN349_c0_g1_i1:6739-8910(-)
MVLELASWLLVLLAGMLALVYVIYSLFAKKTAAKMETSSEKDRREVSSKNVPMPSKLDLLPELIPIKESPDKSIQEIFASLYPLRRYELDQYIYISNTEVLSQLCTKTLSHQKMLGVDIENDSTHTYFGSICLIQISTTDRTYLIDTLSIPREVVKRCLQPIFENTQIIKVFHDCRSDLLWLQRDFNGMLCINIFDTQFMAHRLKKFKFLGLEKLWKHYCNYIMSSDSKKQYQTSDWTSRPLTKDQLNYAAVDPYFLIFLRGALISEFCKTNTIEGEDSLLSVLMEMQKLSTDKIYDQKEYKRGEDWLNALKTRMCVITETSCIAENVFEFLWNLRDLEAKKKNVNPNSICSTETLLAIALQLPESLTELQKIIKVEYAYSVNGFIKKYANEIVECVLKWNAKWKENPLKMRDNSRLLNRNQGQNLKKLERKAKLTTDVIPKKPVYENCRIMAPDGELLCNCDQRKIEWYLKKGLGEIISEKPTILKLKFDPAGRKERTQKDIEDDQFYTAIRDNCCVICGGKENLIRYHVIPVIYRQNFPETLKAHRSHDVVLLCFACHDRSTKDTEEKKQELAKQYAAPIIDKEKQYMAKQVTKASNLARKLLKAPKNNNEKEWKARDSMKKNLTELANMLVKYNMMKPLEDPEQISEKEIEEVTKIELLDDDEGSHGKIIVKSVGDLGEFIRMWRKRFLDNMQPKFLPKGWNVDHRIDRSFGKLSAFINN